MWASINRLLGWEPPRDALAGEYEMLPAAAAGHDTEAAPDAEPDQFFLQAGGSPAAPLQGGASPRAPAPEAEREAIAAVQAALACSRAGMMSAPAAWQEVIACCARQALDFSTVVNAAAATGTPPLEALLQTRDWPSVRHVWGALRPGYYARRRLLCHAAGLISLRDGRPCGLALMKLRAQDTFFVGEQPDAGPPRGQVLRLP